MARVPAVSDLLVHVVVEVLVRLAHVVADGHGRRSSVGTDGSWRFKVGGTTQGGALRGVAAAERSCSLPGSDEGVWNGCGGLPVVLRGRQHPEPDIAIRARVVPPKVAHDGRPPVWTELDRVV